MTPYAGVFHVLVTPFQAGGDVDVTALERLVRFAIDAGAAGLTALGVNGEAAYLDEEERSLVARTVLDAADGAVPVVLGASAPEAPVAAGRAAVAQALGAQAAMVAVPPQGADLVGHLQAVAMAAPGLELVLQDYPASGHEPVDADALAAACAAVPAIRAVKAEDPPTPAKIAALAERVPGISQLGGLGGVHLLWELRSGAAGTMTGFAYPELLARIVDAARSGSWDEAERVYEAALPALVWEAQPVIGLGLRKVLLADRGLLSCARTRAPMEIPADAPAQARAVAKRLEAREVVT